MLGSPLYMSPEQALGKKSIDHRTDLWSLGVVLYEMLTGATPAGEVPTIGALIMQICSQPPRNVQEVAPWVPPELAAIVHKALAMEPEARFASAAEMFRAATALLPSGLALHESLLVRMSPLATSAVAPRFGLPAEATRLPSMPSPAARTMDPSQVAPTTTAGVGRSRFVPPASARGKGRSTAVVSLVAVAVVVGIGSFVVAGRLNGALTKEGAASNHLDVPAEPAPSVLPAAVASSSAPAPVPPPSSPSVAAAPSAEPSGPGPAIVPPHPARPASPSHAGPPHPAASPSPSPSPSASPAPVPVPVPAAPPPAKPKPNCDPPYTLDADGHKHFKPECF